MKKRFTHTGTSTTQNETASKLKLARETLRCLGAPELALAAGGAGDTHDTCYPTCVETRT
jgi:hypothetical protein